MHAGNPGHSRNCKSQHTNHHHILSLLPDSCIKTLLCHADTVAVDISDINS